MRELGVLRRLILVLLALAVYMSATALGHLGDQPAHGLGGVDHFSDDAGSVHEAAINAIADAGITSGCGPATYCPAADVTRAQMASFLARALDLPAAATDRFDDDAGSVHEAAIDAVAAAGITQGCTASSFCPHDPLSRAQTAAFLFRALDLDRATDDAFVDDDGSVHEAAIDAVAAAGITQGCTASMFCPAAAVTRAQMASFLARALGLVVEPTDPPVDDVLPADRRVSWVAGVDGGIPSVIVVADVHDFGAVGDGVSDDTSAFTAAIDAAADGGAVWVPAGRYRLTATLELGDGVVIRGAGADATHLESDLAGSSRAAIEMVTYERGAWTAVSSGTGIGSDTVTVADASELTVGGFAELQQDNDPSVMYTDPLWEQDWALGAIGQVVRVLEVDGNTVRFTPPLSVGLDPDFDPRMRAQGFVERAGVEDLHVERIDDGDGHIIEMKNAADVWVRGVETEMSYRAHIATNTVIGCEIRNNHLHHAHDYGGGGHGYGVALSLHTTACLVEDNVFETLRHAMLVQLGANANVFGYNFSRDPVSETSARLPDISLHGHHPTANLFEGNVVAEVGFSDWWGPLGPHNTLYRTCVNLEGVFLLDHSHRQNLLGNVLVGEPDEVTIDASVHETYLHGNRIDGAVSWDGSVASTELPASLYLDGVPGFFGAAAWPGIGPELATACTNPAQQRWEAGAPIG